MGKCQLLVAWSLLYLTNYVGHKYLDFFFFLALKYLEI